MVAPLGIFIAPTREFGFLAGSANTLNSMLSHKALLIKSMQKPVILFSSVQIKLKL
jgi:hypothetical protein